MTQQLQQQAATSQPTQKQQIQVQIQKKGDTCTAENEPTCSIYCPNGECAAIYHDPVGPCRTSCLPAAIPITLSPHFSIELRASSGVVLLNCFEEDQLPAGLADALVRVEAPIHIRGSFSLDQFIRKLAELAFGTETGGESAT